MVAKYNPQNNKERENAIKKALGLYFFKSDNCAE